MIRWLLSLVTIALFAADVEARILRVHLVDDLGEVNLPVQVGDRIEFHLPEPAIHWSMGNKEHYQPNLQERGFIFSIVVAPSAPTTTLHLKTWNYKVTARVYLDADHPLGTVTRVDCIAPSPMLGGPRLSPDEIEGNWVASVNSADEYPAVAWTDDKHHLELKSGIVQTGGDVALIPVAVRNHGDLRFPIPDPQIYDHHGRPIEAKIVRRIGFENSEPVILPNEEVEIVFKISPASQVAKGARLFIAPAAFPISLDEERAEQPETEPIEAAWVARVEDVESYAPMAWQGAGHHIRATPGAVQWAEDAALIPVSIENLGNFEFPAANILLLDHLERPVKQAQLEHVQGLIGEEPEIGPGESAKVTFRVSSPGRIAKGWGISIAPATFSWSKNQVPAEKPRGPLQGSLALSVRYFGGAANLSDGLTPAASEWTSVQGVGVRVLYGVTRHLSIEGSGDFAWTGTADLGAGREVAETSGRIQAAGLLHSGERWIPFGRLGLGVQVARTTMDTTDESEIVAGMVISFGGGLAVRISDRFMAGLSVAYNSPISGNNESQWFEADLSLGWTWDLVGN